jgi:hypothetical protein
VIDSYKNLLPDSGTNTVTILAQISQQLSNGSQILPPASVPPFKPPTSAVWVNALWFLSLVISLFCALLATLQQYWARRYLRLTNPQCAIHKRARIRSFFAEGVDRFYLPIAVEAIPTLLHISMFLFLTGLVISLFSIHHTIAHIILAATVVCVSVYMVITVMPVVYHNSPYQSPLSGLTWAVPRKIAKTVLSAAYHIVSFQKRTGFIRADSITSLSKKITAYKKRLSKSMYKAAEDAAERQDDSIDARALSWTLDQSDEESELEKFIAGIAKFTRTRKMEDPMGVLKAAISGSKLRSSLYRDVTTLLINATDLGLLRGYKELPEDVRQRRIVMCLEALFFIPQAIEKILRRVAEKLADPKVNRAFASVLESKLGWQMALGFSREWTRYRNRNKQFESIIMGARCMAAVMATRLPDTMTRQILEKQMFITDPDALDRYVGSRDSFLLKNLNHFLLNTAYKYIRVTDTDLPVSTVRIIRQGLELESAAQELRVEFDVLFARLTKFAFEPVVSEVVRKKARELLLELASLRNPASGNGSPPTPMAQLDSPTAMSPVSPTQFPSPTVPGDAYISMLPFPSTPSGEAQPLTSMPSHQAQLEPPQSATLPTMTMPSRDVSQANEERVESPLELFIRTGKM